MKHVKRAIFPLFMVLLLTFSAFDVLPAVENAVTVEAATKVKLNKTKSTLIKGQTLNLKVSGTSAKVKWSSSKSNVASVNSKGKVTAKKKGNTTITAKIGKKKYTCKITVETPSISKKSINLTSGESTTLKLKGTAQKIKWKSSNKSVVTVNSKGKVVAKNAGTATVTATVLKKTYKCKVTVKDPSPQTPNAETDNVPNDTSNSTEDTDDDQAPSNGTGDTSGSCVYVSPTGSKYHCKPNCGRMNPNTATQMTEQDAINKGYSKCKICF